LINGFNLGRHWTIEHSDNRLYIPAPLLREGENTIVVFDVLANEKEKSVFLGEG
jgi:beta-galactosidase